MKIIGFILCRNNSKLLQKSIDKIPDCINSFFVSDDNSTDNSYEVSKQNNVSFYRNKSLSHGYGSNVKSALNIAFKKYEADYAVEIHGDGAQFDPRATIDALEKINKENFDLIIGSRFLRFSENMKLNYPLSRMVPNFVISNIERLLLDIPISDFHSGFRIYSKKFFEISNFSSFSDDYLFSFQCIIEAKKKKLKISDVPVLCDYSSEHTSHKLFGKNSAFTYQLETFKLIYKYFFGSL